MKKPPAKTSASVFGVHPLLAAVGAIVLVLFGAILGVWLGDSERGSQSVAKARPAAQSPPRRQGYPPPGQAPQRFEPPQFLSLPSGGFEPVDEVGPMPAPSQRRAQPAPPPRTTPDLATAALNYAVATDADPRLPAIAIVIDDMGLDRARSQRMISLDGPLTISFLTYAANLQSWSDLARQGGHEVMAHIPMEPLDPREDPGPHALTTALSEAAVADDLARMLGAWSGYIGINNHMGSRFTADRRRMDIVMKDLRARGALWLDSRTSPDSVGMEAAAAAGVPRVARDFFLDNVAEAPAIADQLAQVEAHARKTGTAVAIGHPYDATIKALEKWLETLEAKQLALVPLSEVARRRAVNVGAAAAGH